VVCPQDQHLADQAGDGQAQADQAQGRQVPDLLAAAGQAGRNPVWLGLEWLDQVQVGDQENTPEVGPIGAATGLHQVDQDENQAQAARAQLQHFEDLAVLCPDQAGPVGAQPIRQQKGEQGQRQQENRPQLPEHQSSELAGPDRPQKDSQNQRQQIEHAAAAFSARRGWPGAP